MANEAAVAAEGLVGQVEVAIDARQLLGLDGEAELRSHGGPRSRPRRRQGCATTTRLRRRRTRSRASSSSRATAKVGRRHEVASVGVGRENELAGLGERTACARRVRGGARRKCRATDRI